MIDITFPQAFTIVGLFIPAIVTLYKYILFSNKPLNKFSNGVHTILNDLAKDIVRLNAKFEDIEKGINEIKHNMIRQDKVIKDELNNMRTEFKKDTENIRKSFENDFNFIYKDIKELYGIIIKCRSEKEVTLPAIFNK